MFPALIHFEGSISSSITLTGLEAEFQKRGIVLDIFSKNIYDKIFHDYEIILAISGVLTPSDTLNQPLSLGKGLQSKSTGRMFSIRAHRLFKK